MVVEADPGRAALSARLSWALVAFTVEIDNRFEHEMPHRTTRHGSTPGQPRAPWLVSFPMWVHCLRHVPEDGIRADELVRRSGLAAATMQTVVKRLAAWWGYLSVGGPDAGATGRAARAGRLVRTTSAGARAQQVWRPLEAETEGSWRERFGEAAVGRLRAALGAVLAGLDPVPADYIPLGELRLPPAPGEPDQPGTATLGLSALLSKVLVSLALDFEQHSDLALGIATADHASRLAISANVLRVLEDGGVRTSEVPARAGVAKMSVDHWLGALEERGYVTVGQVPGGGRFKVATPTEKGRRARDFYRQWTEVVEERFADRCGGAPVLALRQALEPFVDGAGDSLLCKGMEPLPGGWRGKVPRPEVLPHYPAVSLRGGFPDGS